MCTSMSPDPRTTRAPMPGPSSRPSQDRRLAPSTSCVAFCARANSSSASVTSSPTTWWYVPPSDSTSARCDASAAGLAPVSPSERATCTPSSSPPTARAAMRAPRRSRVSPSTPPGQRHHDPLPGLPGAGDLVLGAVLLQALLDLVRQPQQRELAQRGQVAHAEVPGQRRVDPLGRVDVAVRHPSAQRLRRHVHQLDLVGRAHHPVRHRLALRHPGDLLDDVVERLQVLHVDGGDDVDAGVEQLLHVLPALLVARARDVAVRELVDERDLRVPGEDGVHVHLGERPAAVLHRPPWQHLEPVGHGVGEHPAVVLDERDHDVGAAVLAAVPLAQHRVRLAHPGCRPEVDPQPPARHAHSLRYPPSWASAMFSSRTFTVGSPRNPRSRPCTWAATRALTVAGSSPRALATRFTCS